MIESKDKSSTLIFKITKVMKPQNGGVRMAWNKEHDKKLLMLVGKHKGRNWRKISEEMKRIFHDSEMSAKKCRERWCNYTNPEIDKTSLTESEELFLLIYHHQHNNKWVTISQQIGRAHV